MELGVPSLEHGLQFTVQDFGARLQQQMRSAGRPLHLLLFDEAAADHLIDRRLDKCGADRFPPAGSVLQNSG